MNGTTLLLSAAYVRVAFAAIRLAWSLSQKTVYHIDRRMLGRDFNALKTHQLEYRETVKGALDKAIAYRGLAEPSRMPRIERSRHVKQYLAIHLESKWAGLKSKFDVAPDMGETSFATSFRARSCP